MELSQLQRHTPHTKGKRVGRGRASGKGKTSGKGTKGQKARSGHRIRPDFREKLKKLPKLRGYRFASIQSKPAVVNLSVLEANFAAGDTITPKLLTERGLVNARRGKTVAVKVLGDGDLTKKLTISGCAVSGSARTKIEAAGGAVAQ